MPPRKFTLEVYGSYFKGFGNPRNRLTQMLEYDHGTIKEFRQGIPQKDKLMASTFEPGKATFKAVVETEYYTPTKWAEQGLRVNIVKQESTIKPIHGTPRKEVVGRLHAGHYAKASDLDETFLDTWWEIAPKTYKQWHDLKDGYGRDMILGIRDNPLFRAITVKMQKDGIRIPREWYEQINSGV